MVKNLYYRFPRSSLSRSPSCVVASPASCVVRRATRALEPTDRERDAMRMGIRDAKGIRDAT